MVAGGEVAGAGAGRIDIGEVVGTGIVVVVVAASWEYVRANCMGIGMEMGGT